MTGGNDDVKHSETASVPNVRVLAGPVEEYLAGIRSALADLPAPELADILDDARAHLADLTAELGSEASLAALVDRLGTPAAYAGELRAAAGYPPASGAPPERSRSGAARLAIAGLVASTVLIMLGVAGSAPEVVLFGMLLALAGLPLVTRDGPELPSLTALPAVRRLAAAMPAPGTAARSVTDFLAALQPAWWVARGVVAAVLVDEIMVGAELALVVLLSLVTVPLSIWLGHRTRRDRRWLCAVVPLNGLAAALLLLLLASSALFGSSSSSSGSVQRYQQPGLWQDMDRQILDIRPVDAAGNPLTGVYLFDQNGRPIDTTTSSSCEDEHRFSAPGASAARPYPRGTVDYDPRTGDCVTIPPGPLVVAVPSETPSATGQVTVPPPTTPPAPPTPPTPPTAPPTPTG
ncbi:DUF1700 domain-containing protein [Pseudonocardia alaniniphila]|uniref:Proline-rich protein n=1 Tax=Pseudonocardia alaniniphila TaxID=75291 RepID=A0ABS9TPK8_9PSEU|nr:hypothetical protein [Pseudonocardia alaniniphila]MCH6170494.1 hypothetical protein [Pseudonocardia alaniniphila]